LRGAQIAIGSAHGGHRKLEGEALAHARFRYFPVRDGGVRRDPAALEHHRRAQAELRDACPNGVQWSFGAGVLFFPVSYIIGDVLTEVYGYANARR
jgi:hypothetical protein